MQTKIMLLLVIFSFGLASLIPQGFMPSFDESGKVAIQICSGDDVKTIYLDQNSDDNTPSHDLEADQCPYAITASSQLLSTSFISSSVLYNANKTGIVLYQTILLSGTHNSPLQSRAPPILS